jgi:hypothetical protein
MRLLIPLFILAVFLDMVRAQAQTVSPDTVSHPAPTDTTKRSGAAGVDTLVNYTAKDSIVYSLRTRFMNLYGNSEMQYQTIDLKAERVNINWDDATLLALGVPDTAKADSIIGKPILRDGGDEYHGDKVLYNFHTRKGKISLGTTHMDNGYYVGEQIKKVETDVLYVENGRYTTCDLEDPHFYFASPKMKVYVRDKVVAEPVFLYIADVPVFALPFGVFPAHAGRTSGIIAPSYGVDQNTATHIGNGWYVSHLGYYWAASDYWDIATMVDLYSRGKWQDQTNLRYALRYNFTGSLTARITSLAQGEAGDPGYNEERDYYVNLTHNQQIDPSSRLDVNFTFASSTYFKNYSYNLDDILKQDIISNATYSKNWEASNRNLSLNIYRDQQLVTGETQETLPSISFSQGTIFPFRKQSKSRGLPDGSESEMGFFDMLGFSYSGSFGNTRTKQLYTVPLPIKTSPTVDTLSTVKDFQNIGTQALSQNIGFSISPKLGHFTVSPSLSFNENRTWTQSTTPGRNPEDSTLIFTSGKKKTIQGFLQSGINTSTRLFGIIQPDILGITAIRHTLTPTVGLTYNKQIYGDNIQKYQMIGSFNVGNVFEMKVQKHDSAGTEDKIQLLNIGGGVNYNFAADSMNFSEVGINYRTDIGQYLGISGSANYNLYEFQYDTLGGHRINQLYFENGKKFGDLTSFSLSVSTSFRGEKKQKASEKGVPEEVLQEQEEASGLAGATPGPRKTYYSIYDKEEADFSIPWNLNISYTFSQSRPTPISYTRSSTANASLSFNLTDKWQISTGMSYDFVNKKQFIPSVDITRDLHCWQMSFSWYPQGIREGYRLEIRVKAPQLRDIKITKQGSARGAYNYND